MSETHRFAVFHVSSENYSGKCREEELTLPLNICNLRESLARSLFITLYKPRNSYVFISLGDIYNSLLEKCAEAFDIIDDCQTIFAKSIKDVPCGVYIIGSVWIAASDLTYVGNNNFQEVDKLYVNEERKAIFKEHLEKAAIIVEGFLQYLAIDEFTEECLALVDDYRATKMLEG